MLCVCMDLTLPDISYKWNHKIHFLFCLIPFIYHNAFKFYSCCSMFQYFSSFHGWTIFHFIHTHRNIHSSVDGNLSCIFAIVNSAAMMQLTLNWFRKKATCVYKRKKDKMNVVKYQHLRNQMYSWRVSRSSLYYSFNL